MALPSTVYRVTIQLSDVERGIYESLQATVARHPSETEERLVARLLAYAIFFDPELSFTKGVSAGDEPDLWVKGPDDRVLLWVEVGLPEADRLIKASRHTEQVALVACGRALPKWEQLHLPKLEGIPNLSVIHFDQAFISNLVATLGRSIIWTVTISDGNLYLNVGEEAFETTLQARRNQVTK
ncbi:MAG: YaeQ family protein [Desulfuromonadaceae bacterium]|nr:YaeQ family protein [Desulfuromonadaceae bacterium]